MENKEEIKVTPFLRQYFTAKEKYKDCIIFFRLGDFYEMFYEDAVEVSKILDLTLTQRGGVPMCGVPHHSSTTYISKLVNKGYKVALCEQLTEAGKSKMHPDIYLNCAEKMGLEPSECVVLEDTCHAIETAKNAGFIVYAIDEDTAVKKEKIKSLCDRYIMDFKELL